MIELTLCDDPIIIYLDGEASQPTGEILFGSTEILWGDTTITFED